MRSLGHDFNTFLGNSNDIIRANNSQVCLGEGNSVESYQVLVERIRISGSEAMFIDSFGAICKYLKGNVSAGDLVVTMGAGDVWKVADEYIQWLGRDS